MRLVTMKIALIGICLACGQATPTSPTPSEAESEAEAEIETEVEASASEVETEAANVESDDEGDSVVLSPVPGSVRLVVVHDADLLGSETRRLDAIAAHMGRSRTVTHEEPTEDEAELARRWIDGSERAVSPRWAHDETVVLIRVASPDVRRSGQRVSKGLSGFVVLRPGVTEAFFHARIDAASAWPLASESGEWIADLLADTGAAR